MLTALDTGKYKIKHLQIQQLVKGLLSVSMMMVLALSWKREWAFLQFLLKWTYPIY